MYNETNPQLTTADYKAICQIIDMDMECVTPARKVLRLSIPIFECQQEENLSQIKYRIAKVAIRLAEQECK